MGIFSRIIMLRAKFSVAFVVSTLSFTAAIAEEIVISDGTALLATKFAKSGAVYFEMQNLGGVEDRLIGVESEIAQKSELHSHEIGADGVARMERLEDGISLPPGQSRILEQGGDHIMLMGLTRAFSQGDHLEISLIFENAGEISLALSVRIARRTARSERSE